MSSYASLKNIIPKRKYRERSQPGCRKDKGFLEKHQDYVKRAAKYHQVEDQMGKLKLKAALKNDNEFSHKMITSQMIDGEHTQLDKVDPGFDEVEYRKILKTRNMNMVKVQKQRLGTLDSPSQADRTDEAHRSVFGARDEGPSAHNRQRRRRVQVSHLQEGGG